MSGVGWRRAASDPNDASTSLLARRTLRTTSPLIAALRARTRGLREADARGPCDTRTCCGAALFGDPPRAACADRRSWPARRSAFAVWYYSFSHLRAAAPASTSKTSSCVPDAARARHRRAPSSRDLARPRRRRRAARGWNGAVLDWNAAARSISTAHRRAADRRLDVQRLSGDALASLAEERQWPTRLRPDRHRRRPGRLRRRDPRRAARHEDRRASSASISAASASTGAASRPRRCCARPRSTTCCTTSTSSASPPTTSRFDLRQGGEALARGRQAAVAGVAHLLKKNKVTVFDGAGELAGKAELAVDEGRQAGRRR